MFGKIKFLSSKFVSKPQKFRISIHPAPQTPLKCWINEVLQYPLNLKRKDKQLGGLRATFPGFEPRAMDSQLGMVRHHRGTTEEVAYWSPLSHWTQVNFWQKQVIGCCVPSLVCINSLSYFRMTNVPHDNWLVNQGNHKPEGVLHFQPCNAIP